jgi:uncharacterized protein YegP (UPF0339 family)
MALRIELKKSGKLGRWWFRIKARNGRILCYSELYNSKKAAQSAMRLLQNNTIVDEKGER